jgi:cyclic pyranopterin monophosphate synthase
MAMAKGKRAVPHPKKKVVKHDRRRRAQAEAKPSERPVEPAPVPTPLTHIDQRGEARMVDVSEKGATERIAIAEGRVLMRKETLDIVLEGNAMKGDVLGAARLAGIMAAKRTHGLIPLCHPLPLTKVEIDINPEHSLPGFLVQSTVKVTAKTGVEMEALTAVSIACLTIYDMVKAVERGIRIEGIRLLHKSGGKSGEWNAGG